LFMQRVHANTTDAKRFSADPKVTRSSRSTVLVQLQCINSGVIPEKEAEGSLSLLLKQLEAAPHSNVRSDTLLDVARCALLRGLGFSTSSSSAPTAAAGGAVSGSGSTLIGKTCYNLAVAATSNVIPPLRVKMDVCDALIALCAASTDPTQPSVNRVANQRLSAAQQEGYKLNRRVECVKQLERAAMLAMQVISHLKTQSPREKERLLFLFSHLSFLLIFVY
jgi:hypothetical protein